MGGPRGPPTGVGLARSLADHDLQIVLPARAPERRDVQFGHPHGFEFVVESARQAGATIDVPKESRCLRAIIR